MANNNPNTLSADQETRIKQVYDDIYNYRQAIDTLGVSWQPSINRILVLTDPISAILQSGLIVPDTAKERPEFGTVVAVGPGRTTEHGVLVPNLQAVGNRVQFGKYAGAWIYDDQLDLYLTLMLDADCVVHRPQPSLLSTHQQPDTTEHEQVGNEA